MRKLLLILTLIYAHSELFSQKMFNVSDNPLEDDLYGLVFDFVHYQQEERLKTIESALKNNELDLNRSYKHGLTLSHLIVINYLTYTTETDFEGLLDLLTEYGLDFCSKNLSKDFHDPEYYPYDLKEGDGCASIVAKILKHANHNGRDSQLLQDRIADPNNQ